VPHTSVRMRTSGMALRKGAMVIGRPRFQLPTSFSAVHSLDSSALQRAAQGAARPHGMLMPLHEEFDPREHW
jgi:hypothetical protein